jgi:hypothetical protein
MSNRPCPWHSEEIAALKRCAAQGMTDVEAAEAVAISYTAPQRRTPAACRTKALTLGLDVIWTTRPAALTQGYKAQCGHEDENPHVKTEREDSRFIAAMQKAGYAPQEPSRDPGTNNPRQLGPHREGRPSSSSGWIA